MMLKRMLFGEILSNYKVSGKRHAPDGFEHRARWILNAPDGNPKERPRHMEV